MKGAGSWRSLVVASPVVSGVERRAVREAGMAGAREVHLIDEPVAAAIGLAFR